MPIDPKLRKALTGISGILVTPFDAQDRVAPARLAPIIDRAITAGVHILVINGNTSEFYGLTTAEAETMVQAAAELIGGRVPLIAGVGRSINDACALARASRAAGASALMVHQPPDPFVAPRGVVAYLERIAQAGGGLPIMLYLRNDGIGLDAIDALCRVPGVAGVKWAAPTPLRLAEAIRRAPADIVWVGGLAEVWAPPLCAVGARGFTSGLINVWPEHSVAIHAALEAGDYARAMQLIDVMAGFEAIRAEEQNGANVTGVKAALQLLGNDCGPTRPPSAWPLTERQQAELRRLMTSWNLLPREDLVKRLAG
ncbi:MAG TPA: dihydrodipicolinate synthase family protein [Xanthobacteraceae bacterium]|jgi:4-hydroxy-tetrahydrodipicolinate synthase|nr:dihydrodipicolinate synthase family protein [Xanthobacteraceae bacterium]